MKGLGTSLLVGFVVALMMFSPIIVGCLVLIVLGLVVAALGDLFTAIRGGRGSSNGRQYWRPGQ